MADRIAAYKRVALQFLEDPCESKLIMLKTLFNNLSESKLSIYHQEQLATDIIDEMHFISRSLPSANSAQFKEDLLYFIKNMLHRYKNNDQHKGFGKEELI